MRLKKMHSSKPAATLVDVSGILTPSVSMICLIMLCVSHLIPVAYQGIQHGWWVIVFYLCCTLLRSADIKRSKRIVTHFVQRGLFVCGLGIVTLTAFNTTVLDSLFVMLVVALSLKLLELKNVRDLIAINVIHVFLIASGMLFYLDLYHTALFFISLFLGGVASFVFLTPSVSFKSSMKINVSIFAYAVPLAFGLFFVMPQLPPLWKMAKPEMATTGLGDRVSPGDIASLSKSAKLAFRATFSGDKPQQEALYWRALVHENFDGRAWNQSKYSLFWQKSKASRHLNNPTTPIPDVDLTTPFYQYTVIVEPTYQRWLFALDIAQTRDPSIDFSPDFTLVRKDIITQTLQYDVKSYHAQPLVEPNLELSLMENLRLPEVGNPQTRLWVEQLKEVYPSNEALINAVLNQFREQAYRYTLQPPVLGEHSIDEFLFQTQAGFCGHYASAFSYIMRLAGIPARVVTGYLGGEWNPKGAYYSVYQYDAHAWSEVYIDGKGWIRFDPTSYVAPERVESSLEFSLDDSSEFLSDDRFALIKFKNWQVINELRYLISNVDYQWTKWILNYNNQAQKDLFKKLFGTDKGWLFYVQLIGAVIVFVACIVLGGYLKSRHLKRYTKIEKLYLKAIKKLENNKASKQPCDTLHRVIDLVYKNDTEAATKWREIAVLFDGALYQCLTPSEQKQILKQLKLKLRHV